MPGNHTRKLPADERRDGHWHVTLSPGDPLPAGRYVKAWKLDTSLFGPDRLYLVYDKPEDEAA